MLALDSILDGEFACAPKNKVTLLASEEASRRLCLYHGIHRMGRLTDEGGTSRGELVIHLAYGIAEACSIRKRVATAEESHLWMHVCYVDSHPFQLARIANGTTTTHAAQDCTFLPLRSKLPRSLLMIESQAVSDLSFFLGWPCL